MASIIKIGADKPCDFLTDLYGTQSSQKYRFLSWQIKDSRVLFFELSRYILSSDVIRIGSVDLFSDTLVANTSNFPEYVYSQEIDPHFKGTFIGIDSILAGDPGDWRIFAKLYREMAVVNLSDSTETTVNIQTLTGVDDEYVKGIFLPGITDGSSISDLDTLLSKVVIVNNGSLDSGTYSDLYLSLLTNNPAQSSPTAWDYFYKTSPESNIGISKNDYGLSSVLGIYPITEDKLGVIAVSLSGDVIVQVLKFDLANWPVAPTVYNTIYLDQQPSGELLSIYAMYSGGNIFMFSASNKSTEENEHIPDGMSHMAVYYDAVGETSDPINSEFTLSKSSTLVGSEEVIEIVFRAVDGYGRQRPSGTTSKIYIANAPATPDDSWGALASDSSGPFFDGSGAPLQTELMLTTDSSGEVRAYYKAPRSLVSAKQEIIRAINPA